MGFYDPTSVRLCTTFEGNGLTHREPALGELDFDRYVKSFSPLVQDGRDVLWVLDGRTESSVAKIKKIPTQANFNFQTFHLCYNTKQMHMFGIIRRKRGVANSRNHELLFLCYKGRLPKQLAKSRAYVDAGSETHCEVVRNVPVLSPKKQALVSREIREKSLTAMAGVVILDVEAKDQDHTPVEEDWKLKQHRPRPSS